MNADPNSQTPRGISEQINDQFKCRECGAISQPITSSMINVQPEFQLSDAYFCAYCDTGFLLTQDHRGMTQRQELSAQITEKWVNLPF